MNFATKRLPSTPPGLKPAESAPPRRERNCRMYKIFGKQRSPGKCAGGWPPGGEKCGVVRRSEKARTDTTRARRSRPPPVVFCEDMLMLGGTLLVVSDLDPLDVRPWPADDELLTICAAKRKDDDAD